MNGISCNSDFQLEIATWILQTGEVDYLQISLLLLILNAYFR